MTTTLADFLQLAGETDDLELITISDGEARELLEEIDHDGVSNVLDSALTPVAAKDRERMALLIVIERDPS